MPKNNGKRFSARRRQSNQTGPSRAPQTTLRRTFRYTQNIRLNNSTGSGIDQYAYYSKYLFPDPAQALGFKDAQQTFEFYRIQRLRVKAQPSYNDYNQTYNTVNQDSIAAMQVWTAADFSTNENISGISIMSYNNARCHTLSLNGLKTVVNTRTVINQNNQSPRTILPANTWLDTSVDITSGNVYSGAQIFIRMPGMNVNNYLPYVQLIFEVDVEFKQPGYQNRPSTFEQEFVGSSLLVIPDASTPEVTREYKVIKYILDDAGNKVRLERADGVPGLLEYTQEEFWEVFFHRTSGQYFNNRAIDYIGPVPRKPLGWSPQ